MRTYGLSDTRGDYYRETEAPRRSSGMRGEGDAFRRGGFRNEADDFRRGNARGEAESRRGGSRDARRSKESRSERIRAQVPHVDAKKARSERMRDHLPRVNAASHTGNPRYQDSYYEDSFYGEAPYGEYSYQEPRRQESRRQDSYRSDFGSRRQEPSYQESHYQDSYRGDFQYAASRRQEPRSYGDAGRQASNRDSFYYEVEPEYDTIREPEGLDEERFGDDADAAEEPKGFFASISARVGKLKRSVAKARAGKDFQRRYGGDDKPSDASAGPRAAVYKGEMGSQHRRAARMQDSGSDQSRRTRTTSTGTEKKSRGVASRMLIASGALVACFAFCALFLYTPAQQYYQEIRELARLEAEYAAVLSRNEALAADVAHLSTDEGIEDVARAEFGWIKEGEYAVNVLGVEDEGAVGFTANVLSSDIDFPETWYSKYLDPIFGIE